MRNRNKNKCLVVPALAVSLFVGFVLSAHAQVRKIDGGVQRDSEKIRKTIKKTKKHVRAAEKHQKKALNKIKAGANEDAIKDQTKTIDELIKAKNKLEKLLRQVREEEKRRLLAALKIRCTKMLRMQIAVRKGTSSLNQAIGKRADGKATNMDTKTSLALADDEAKIVLLAADTLKLLKGDGSSAVFPEVFKQVYQDMKIVKGRLDIVDAGKVTIAIEDDIIATLKEILEAIKDAQKPPRPPGPTPPGPGDDRPPNDPKLIKLLAELKLIRSMQLRIYYRTKTYGRLYRGEQAENKLIRRELRSLANRQERIYRVTEDLAKGANK